MTSKSPLVTVIVPAYNIGAHLQNTIKSILNQSERRLSLIVVDDGSTDDTYEVARKYACTDSRITVLQKENGGVSSARNMGISHVNTPYYTFIDGDDIVSRIYLERLVAIAYKTGADIVSSQMCSVKANRAPVDMNAVLFSKPKVLHGESLVLDFLYNKGIQNSSCAKLYRSSLLKDIRFDDKLTMGEDMEYVFRTFQASSSVAITQDKLYFYIQRTGSAMNAAFSAKWMHTYHAAIKIAKHKELTAKTRKAAYAKIFTESFSILVAMSTAKVADTGAYATCYESVRALAFSVLKNNRARLWQRLYATISIVNIRLAIKIASTKKEILKRKMAQED